MTRNEHSGPRRADGERSGEETALEQAIAEATSAFDAGNHAWGRFYLYVLRRYRGSLPAPDPAPVRTALQEAALAVPQTANAEEAWVFAEALAAALRELQAFIDALPDPLRAGDVLVAPGAFADALRALQPVLSPDG